MVRILVTCVNYNNYQEVIDYINHLEKQTIKDHIEIVVTDNSNNRVEFSYLSEQLKEYANVYCFDAFQNLGYLNGMNYGVSHYLKNHKMPEWIILSNTDITYENDFFYEDLLLYYPMGYNSIIAPSIYSSTSKNYQNPLLIKRYKKARIRAFMFIFKYPILEYIFDWVNNFKNKFQKRKTSLLENQKIYSGHGSCLIINKQFFLNGGNLNYGSFLFGEEIYISEMVMKSGGSVYFDHRLKVIHHEHSTMSREKRYNINKFYYESMSYLYNTFYN